MHENHLQNKPNAGQCILYKSIIFKIKNFWEPYKSLTEILFIEKGAEDWSHWSPRISTRCGTVSSFAFLVFVIKYQGKDRKMEE